MKNVVFTKIGMENFGCYIEPFELEIFPGKLTMISGPNGKGKTTIFDSVSFTLYGITSKGLKAQSVVNNKTGKNCHTWCEFTIDDVPYRADRYYAHSRMKNTAILKRNGIPYKKGPSEVNSEIERILIPLKLFNNSIMFGQKVKTFFTDLKDTDQKEIFRKILKLDDYVIYHKKTGELIKSISQLLTENMNKQTLNKDMIDNFEREISLLIKEKLSFGELQQQKINEYKEHIILLNSNIESLKLNLSKYENCEKDMKTFNDDRSECNSTLKELEVQFKSIVEQIQLSAKNKQLEMSNKASQMESEETIKFNELLKKLDSEINKQNSELHAEVSKYEKEKAVIESEIQSLRLYIHNSIEEVEKFENTINADISTCPTCNQEIDDNTVRNLKDYIQSLKEKIEQSRGEIERKRTTIQNIDGEITKLRFAYKNIDSKLQQKKLEADTERKNNIDGIKTRLNTAIEKLRDAVRNKVQEQTENIRKEKNKIVSCMEKLDENIKIAEDGYNQYNKINRSISESDFQIKNYQNLIKSKSEEQFDNSRIQMYIDKKEHNKIEIQKLEENEKNIKKNSEILDFWREAFSKSGIESMLIDESIPFMNERVNEYLEDLSFGRYSLTFDTIKQLGGNKDEYRDKIQLNVLDSETLSDSREKFSGGQTRILDIAVILTLCDLQSNIQDMKFNLLLFDEIFDALDDDNILKVSKLLRKLIKEKSIYLVSHRHIDHIEVDDELKFM